MARYYYSMSSDSDDSGSRIYTRSHTFCREILVSNIMNFTFKDGSRVPTNFSATVNYHLSDFLNRETLNNVKYALESSLPISNVEIFFKKQTRRIGIRFKYKGSVSTSTFGSYARINPKIRPLFSFLLLIIRHPENLMIPISRNIQNKQSPLDSIVDALISFAIAVDTELSDHTSDETFDTIEPINTSIYPTALLSTIVGVYMCGEESSLPSGHVNGIASFGDAFIKGLRTGVEKEKTLEILNKIFLSEKFKGKFTADFSRFIEALYCGDRRLLNTYKEEV